MKRRSFLAILGLAPIAAASAVKLVASRPDLDADGTYRLASGYSPEDGWHSGIGIRVRMGDGAEHQAAGLLLDASTAGPSRILIEADRFEMPFVRPDRFYEFVPFA